MFSEVRKRSKKAGQPPGTLIYTGNKKAFIPYVTVITYSETDFRETSGPNLEECLKDQIENPITTWINIDGLHDLALIQELAARYHLHPLTIEDILNVEQRSKLEEFDDYIFITLKVLRWNTKKSTFSIEELSLIIGEGYILTFFEQPNAIFDSIREKIRNSSHQPLRKSSSDYLAYRLIDTVVDFYFVVLEGLGYQIEQNEDAILANPTKQNLRTLFRLKRKMLLLRKAIWPIRDVVSHLLKIEGNLFSPYMHIYMRDVYDHTVQAMDTVETYREMLSNMLDIYLSTLTNRMNEIMKVLTIIATIFIPVTFIASIYGMNFIHMPELHMKYGYPVTLSVMGTVILIMLYYFYRKNWL